MPPPDLRARVEILKLKLAGKPRARRSTSPRSRAPPSCRSGADLDHVRRRRVASARSPSRRRARVAEYRVAAASGSRPEGFRRAFHLRATSRACALADDMGTALRKAATEPRSRVGSRTARRNCVGRRLPPNDSPRRQLLDAKLRSTIVSTAAPPLGSSVSQAPAAGRRRVGGATRPVQNGDSRPLYVIVPVVLAAAVALGVYGYRYAAQLAEKRRAVAGRVQPPARRADARAHRQLHHRLGSLALRPRRSRSPRRLRQRGTTSCASRRPSRRRSSSTRSCTSCRAATSRSKKATDAEAFRALFMKKILPDLPLDELKLDLHKHLHQEYDGRDYLISFIKKSAQRAQLLRRAQGLARVRAEPLFPDVLEPLVGKVLFCVRDEHGRVVYGAPVGQPGQVPLRAAVSDDALPVAAADGAADAARLAIGGAARAAGRSSCSSR